MVLLPVAKCYTPVGFMIQAQNLKFYEIVVDLDWSKRTGDMMKYERQNDTVQSRNDSTGVGNLPERLQATWEAWSIGPFGPSQLTVSSTQSCQVHLPSVQDVLAQGHFSHHRCGWKP